MTVVICEIEQAEERNLMKQIRVSAMIFALLFALSTLAQSGRESNQESSARYGLPTVQEQLKVLTGKLALNADQQVKIKPIIEELHDATLKLMQDEKLSEEERLGRVRPLRYNADKKIREILNDEQKKKLDQYEQGPHHEMHGNLEPKTQ